MSLGGEREPTQQQQERERGRVGYAAYSSTATGYATPSRERVYGGSRAGSPAQRQDATPTPAPVNGSTAQYAPGSSMTTTYAPGTSSPTPQYTTLDATPRTLTARYQGRPCRPPPHPRAPPRPSRPPPRRSRLRRSQGEEGRGRKRGGYTSINDTPPRLRPRSCAQRRSGRPRTPRTRPPGTGSGHRHGCRALRIWSGRVRGWGRWFRCTPRRSLARLRAARAHARPLAHAPSVAPLARAQGWRIVDAVNEMGVDA
ncbi:hypothetical protein C8J57DRAFT_493244 [Mycena rebaudengoi]|nr:hypothetical protein C8J57DRAFT_493244 [Mycena rebaudengoi]